jgi:hypothetical protein
MTMISFQFEQSSLLTNKLISLRFLQSRLYAACHKYYNNDLRCQYNLPFGQMLSDVFHTNRYAFLDKLNLTIDRTVYLI